MEEAENVFYLEECLGQHTIDTSIFAPFAVENLRMQTQMPPAEFTLHLRDVITAGEQTRRIQIFWNAQTAFTLPLAVQEHIITEWAACGIACALAPRYTGLSIRAVAQLNDRFDYWIGDETTEWGLEVSGTQTEDEKELQDRLRRKIRQLRQNPYGIGGYVIVVGFALRQIYFSYYAPENEEAS